MINIKPVTTDFYTEIEFSQEFETKIKGSRFIGQAFPIESKDLAENILQNIRKKNYSATHNCFAYSLGANSEIFRYSDDGEPSGTAGKPIFQAINHFDYKNILVVVTRYFGGTKLGVGPLARAYYDSAKEVLEKCEKKIVFLTTKFEIESDYTFISTLKYIFEDFSVSLKEEYFQNVLFTVDVLNSQASNFEKIIIEKTNGKIRINKV